ncbi:YybS family protein [Bacillus kexueae]|uniref:YybS family protein n=1 Tax=Aeribacillus kexueae TaxID=2078952 RepID=UPI001FAEE4A2|nr:YybS family protein [Bacillus kexueae]
MKQTRFITDAAILLAIFAVLLAMTLYLPLIGAVALVFLATPFIIMVYRHDMKKAWFMFAGALLISFIVGQLLSVPLVLMYGVVGIVMGHFYKKQQPFVALVLGSLAFLGGLLLTYGLSVLLFGMNWMAEITNEVNRTFEDTAKMFAALGQDVPEEAFTQIESQLQLLGMMLPTILVMAAVFSAFITHAVNRPIMKRLKMEMPAITPFRNWRLPKSIIWYYLIVIFMQFMNIESGSFLFIAVLNLTILLQVLLLIQGLSFLFYYSHIKNKGKWLPAIGVIISILLYPVQELVRILGIIDLGFDLRSRLKR